MSCSFQRDEPEVVPEKIWRNPIARIEQQTVRKVSSCPIHGKLSNKEQHGRCWSDISCGLSGCYCVKKKSKINSLLKKILGQEDNID